MTDQTNDVLNRLRAMAGTGGWNANIIRDAITEWEVSTKHIATQDWQSVSGEPFAVSDTGRVWFRRRVP